MAFTHSILEDNSSPIQVAQERQQGEKTPQERFARARWTLSQPAKARPSDRGTTMSQRTAARFVLTQLLRDGFCKDNDEAREYIHGAFRHAFAHNDVARCLLKAIQDPENGCPSLDFSEVEQQVNRDAANARRAARKHNLDKRRANDRAACMVKRGLDPATAGAKKKGKKK